MMFGKQSDKELPHVQLMDDDESSNPNGTIDFSYEKGVQRSAAFGSLADQSLNTTEMQAAHFQTRLPQNQGVVSFASIPLEQLEGTDPNLPVVATEEDFTFIHEVITQAGTDLREKEILPTALLEISQQHHEDPQELESSLNIFAQEITAQFSEFQRVIDFTAFLIDQARLAQNNEQEASMQLETSRREISDLQEREQCMIGDWRLEQNRIRELESECKKREDEVIKVRAQLNIQKQCLDSLYTEKSHFEQVLQEHQKIATQLQRENQLALIKIKTLEGANSESGSSINPQSVDKRRIDDLETTILLRTDELDEANQIIEDQKGQIEEMNQVNIEVNDDLEEAQQMLEEYEERIQLLEAENNTQDVELQRLQSLQQEPNKLKEVMGAQGMLSSYDDATSSHTMNNVPAPLRDTTSDFGNPSEYRLADFTPPSGLNTHRKVDSRSSNDSNGIVVPMRKTTMMDVPTAPTMLTQLVDKIRNEDINKSQNEGNKVKLEPQIRISICSDEQDPEPPQIQEGIETDLPFENNDSLQDLEHNDVMGDEGQQEMEFPDQQSQISRNSRMDDHFQNLPAQDAISKQSKTESDDIRLTVEATQESPTPLQVVDIEDSGHLQIQKVSQTNVMSQVSNESRFADLKLRVDDSQSSKHLRLTENAAPRNELQMRLSQISTVKTRLKERRVQLKQLIQNADLKKKAPQRALSSRSTFTVAFGEGGGQPAYNYPSNFGKKKPLSPGGSVSMKKFDFADTIRRNSLAPPTMTPVDERNDNSVSDITDDDVPITLTASKVSQTIKLADLDNYKPSPGKTSHGLLTLNPEKDPLILTSGKRSMGQLQAIIDQKQSMISARSSQPREESEYKPRPDTEVLQHKSTMEEFKPVMEIVLEEEPSKLTPDVSQRTFTRKSNGLLQSIRKSMKIDIHAEVVTSPQTSPGATSCTSARRRALGQRKKPEEEFFYMTLVSQVMSHPQKNTIIALVTDSVKIYQKCLKENSIFYEWPEWIQNYLIHEVRRLKLLASQQCRKLLKPE